MRLCSRKRPTTLRTRIFSLMPGTPASSFAGLASLTTASPSVMVNGAGSFTVDFATESAAWVELDSPDIAAADAALLSLGLLTACGGDPPAKPEAPKPAAPEHKPLSVPQRSGPQESLVKKVAHTEHKDEPPKIRLKTIKRGSCVEVGHDLFDEKVTEFLNKVGQENIIHMNTIGYGAMDSTGHMLPDYGILIVYKG